MGKQEKIDCLCRMNVFGIMCWSRTQSARKYKRMKRVLEGKYHSSLLGSEFAIRKSIGFFTA